LDSSTCTRIINRRPEGIGLVRSTGIVGLKVKKSKIQQLDRRQDRDSGALGGMLPRIVSITKEYPVVDPDSSLIVPGTESAPEDQSLSASDRTMASRSLLLIIMAAVFMVSAEARVIAPILPALAGDFQTSAAQAGLLITAYTIPYGVFQIVYGPLADRFSRQQVMGAALGLFAIGTFVSGFAPNFLTLTVLRFCTGAAAAGVIPVALAYVGDAVPYTDRQAVLGRIFSIAALGGVLSAALGGLIATVADWRMLFIMYGAVALVVAAVLLRAPVRRVRQVLPPRQGLLTPYRAIFQHAGAGAYALYALVFIEGLTATSTIGYFGALLFERDRFSYASIGVLLMLNGIASMLTARLVGRLVLRVGEQRMLHIGGACLTLAYLLAGIRPTLLFFPMAMLLHGAGYVIAHSTLQTRATELVPNLRGTAMALFAFALFLGGGLGTYIAGAAIERWGFLITLNGTAAALAIFTLVAGPLLRMVQRQHPARS
jgi:predicted MFS family arabinose efflux permease